MRKNILETFFSPLLARTVSLLQGAAPMSHDIDRTEPGAAKRVGSKK